jgi:hypothetical protein
MGPLHEDSTSDSKSNPYTWLDRPLELQEVEDPSIFRQFLDKQHMKVQEIQLMIISVTGSVNPMVVVQPFMIISHWIALRMRNVLDKFAEKIKTHILHLIAFFPKIMPFMR